eukprot:4934884-Karenia_brevis.AAC.1
MCSDASTTGIGVGYRNLDIADIQVHGRQCEKWRFKTEEAVKARQKALGTGDGPIATIEKHKPFILSESHEFADIPVAWMR